MLVRLKRLDKETILEAYQRLAQEGDNAAIEFLFDLRTDGISQEVDIDDLDEEVMPGDVVAFYTPGSYERGLAPGHVTLVLEKGQGGKSWVASHWRFPREGLVFTTPERILNASKKADIENLNTRLDSFTQKLEGLVSGSLVEGSEDAIGTPTDIPLNLAVIVSAGQLLINQYARDSVKGRLQEKLVVCISTLQEMLVQVSSPAFFPDLESSCEIAVLLQKLETCLKEKTWAYAALLDCMAIVSRKYRPVEEVNA